MSATDTSTKVHASTFVYEPMGPSLAVNGPPYRYFSRQKDYWRDFYPLTIESARIQVMRVANHSVALVTCETDSQGVRSSLTLQLDAKSLREIAARLLDAAHDLDTYPSSQLMAEGGAL